MWGLQSPGIAPPRRRRARGLLALALALGLEPGTSNPESRRPRARCEDVRRLQGSRVPNGDVGEVETESAALERASSVRSAPGDVRRPGLRGVDARDTRDAAGSAVTTGAGMTLRIRGERERPRGRERERSPTRTALPLAGFGGRQATAGGPPPPSTASVREVTRHADCNAVRHARPSLLVRSLVPLAGPGPDRGARLHARGSR